MMGNISAEGNMRKDLPTFGRKGIKPAALSLNWIISTLLIAVSLSFAINRKKTPVFTF